VKKKGAYWDEKNDEENRDVCFSKTRWHRQQTRVLFVAAKTSFFETRHVCVCLFWKENEGKESKWKERVRVEK